MGQQLYTPGQSGYWTATITGEVIVECWGGGGVGGGGNSNNQGGGGGAGGQYAKTTYYVVKGTNYTYYAAPDKAGVGTDTDGPAGADSYLYDSSLATYIARAKGGAGGLCYDNGGTGAAGSTDSGVGETVYAGGDGADSGAGYGGGGGGGAGSTGTGNSASTSTGGAAKDLNGGAGGNGGIGSSEPGSPGEDYGGGGGGSTKNQTSGGGNGGYMKISWENIAGSRYDLNFREYGFRTE